MLLDTLPGLDQQDVSLAMSQRVVHILELVQVDDQKRERTLVAHHPLRGLFQAITKQAPIGKPGQIVIKGQLLDLCLVRLPRRNIE